MAGELPPDTTSRSQSISLPPLEPGSPTTACSSLPRPSASTTVAPRRTRTPRRSSALNAGLEPFAAQVGHRHQLHARVHQRQRRLEAAVADRGHHGARAGLDRPERGQPARAARQHHAGQVVAGEQQRLLDRAGGVHVAPGADLMQGAPLPDRHEAVEGAQRRARSRAPPRRPRGRARPARARGRGRPRRAAARRARGPRRTAPCRRPARRRRSRADSPAAPPPTTSTSAWRRRYSVRHSRSGWLLRSFPSPAAWRSTFS